MPLPRQRLTTDLTARFATIRAAAGVAESFPPEVLELARQRATAPPALESPHRTDRRDIELLSIDPEGSRDLDQALAIERRGSGYRFQYAIADVGAWVEPLDAIDVEARKRAMTIYSPDRRVPLHPPELSEGAASLLGDVDRPVVLWTIDLDQLGEIADIGVERSLVRNRRALSYRSAQDALDAGTADEQLRLIEEVGHLRTALEVRRGGVSLELPDQIVEPDGDRYRLRYDAALPVERWNAQLSLCCGMAAAQLMIGAGCGILRTLPAADPTVIERLRISSTALGVAWPAEMSYPDWVHSLDADSGTGAALMVQAARTLRGASYLPFDGDLPADHRHSAIAADYAHVTAPLRRLVDRFANECVLAAAGGKRPSSWALEALPLLPELMAAGSRRANNVDRAAVDLVEAAVLTHRIGTVFEATVTSSGRGVSTIQLVDPAVIASVAAELAVGTSVDVRLEAADIEGPTVRFSLTV